MPSREREQHRQGQGIVKSCDVFGKQNGWDVVCVWPRHGKRGDMVSNEEWNHILRILNIFLRKGYCILRHQESSLFIYFSGNLYT